MNGTTGTNSSARLPSVSLRLAPFAGWRCTIVSLRTRRESDPPAFHTRFTSHGKTAAISRRSIGLVSALYPEFPDPGCYPAARWPNFVQVNRSDLDSKLIQALSEEPCRSDFRPPWPAVSHPCLCSRAPFRFQMANHIGTEALERRNRPDPALPGWHGLTPKIESGHPHQIAGAGRADHQTQYRSRLHWRGHGLDLHLEDAPGTRVVIAGQ